MTSGRFKEFGRDEGRDVQIDRCMDRSSASALATLCIVDFPPGSDTAARCGCARACLEASVWDACWSLNWKPELWECLGLKFGRTEIWKGSGELLKQFTLGRRDAEGFRKSGRCSERTSTRRRARGGVRPSHLIQSHTFAAGQTTARRK